MGRPFSPPRDEEETRMVPSGKVAELNVNSTVSLSLSLFCLILYEISASTVAIPENSNSYSRFIFSPSYSSSFSSVVETVFSFSYIHVYIISRAKHRVFKSIAFGIYLNRRQKWEYSSKSDENELYNILSLPLNAYCTTAYAVPTNYPVYLYFQLLFIRARFPSQQVSLERIQFIR